MNAYTPKSVAQYLDMLKDALKGADILRVAPQQYTSSITYPNTPIAQNMKAIAQVLSADLGTRVYHTEHRSFDTHAAELTSHAKLWTEVSTAIGAFIGSQGNCVRPLTRLSLKATEPSGAMRAVKPLVS